MILDEFPIPESIQSDPLGFFARLDNQWTQKKLGPSCAESEGRYELMIDKGKIQPDLSIKNISLDTIGRFSKVLVYWGGYDQGRAGLRKQIERMDFGPRNKEVSEEVALIKNPYNDTSLDVVSGIGNYLGDQSALIKVADKTYILCELIGAYGNHPIVVPRRLSGTTLTKLNKLFLFAEKQLATPD